MRYELYDIENAQGTGEKRTYVRLMQPECRSVGQLCDAVEKICTANAADVRAVLSALSQVAQADLSDGRRFYLPGIGYFSLSAGILPRARSQGGRHKITGNDIYIRGIRFKPEAELMKGVRRGVQFEKVAFYAHSPEYSDEDLWEKVREIARTEGCVTNLAMRSRLGLSRYKAQKWLDSLAADGRLAKRGTPHHPLYFVAGESV